MKPAEAAHALAIDGLRKRFGATLALDGASVTIGRGEVHALLGENGAGKSTLVRILSGLTRPDAGTISVFGERVRTAGPRGARALGIATAFQEVTLVPDLAVQDNLLLDVAPTRLGFVLDRRRARRWTEAALARLELGSVDPRREILRLPATAAPETRDRPSHRARAADPAARRADLGLLGPGRRMARTAHRRISGARRHRPLHHSPHARGPPVLRPPKHLAQRPSGRDLRGRRDQP